MRETPVSVRVPIAGGTAAVRIRWVIAATLLLCALFALMLFAWLGFGPMFVLSGLGPIRHELTVYNIGDLTLEGLTIHLDGMIVAVPPVPPEAGVEVVFYHPSSARYQFRWLDGSSAGECGGAYRTYATIKYGVLVGEHGVRTRDCLESFRSSEITRWLGLR